MALFVFDPSIRPWFEIPIWIGINFIGVFFLAFALEYTGRGGLVRSQWMAAIVLLQVVHTFIVITNPLHGIAWTGYEITPMLGAATVTYSHSLWLSVNFTGIYLMVAGGAFLLFDAFFSYGQLYRIQAAAIALSPVLPGLAFLVWLLGIGITPPLNLTPLTFPIHLGFIFFAFFRRNMFEVTPAARRVSERTAIDVEFSAESSSMTATALLTSITKRVKSSESKMIQFSERTCRGCFPGLTHIMILKRCPYRSMVARRSKQLPSVNFVTRPVAKLDTPSFSKTSRPKFNANSDLVSLIECSGTTSGTISM